MKCVSCNSELKENAKFCAICGSPVKQHGSNAGNTKKCSNCNSPLKERAVFCAICGTKVDNKANLYSSNSNAEQTTSSMTEVKGMIYWEVQQGEIARRVSETEFIQYDSAKGLIINDGTTAYIKSDGAQIAELQGGVYNFISQEELDVILETRVGGFVGGIKNGYKGFVNAILGKKIKDKVADNKDDVYYQDSLDKIEKCMRQDKILSLILKLDKQFELLFGESQDNIDEYSQFKPMTIRTKYLDVQMGVRATFKVTDYSKFSTQYLADRDSVSTSYLADIITPLVKEAIQRVMSDVELPTHTISPYLNAKLSDAITTKVNTCLQGMSLLSVTEIVVEAEDLERHRALSRELYLSEKELDYLTRANDYKNRLNVQIDKQEIYEARRSSEKDEILLEINKDNLLSREEFIKFNEVLELERAIRSVNSQEEMDKLLHNVSMRKFDREFAMFEREHLMNKRQQIAMGELEKVELDRLRQARLSTARTDIDEQQIRDDYTFTVEDRKAAQNEKKALSAIERLKMIKEMEQQEKDNAHRREMEQTSVSNEHEINLKKTDISKIETMGNLSPDQLMAIAINENMAPEVAMEFAKSFSEKYKGLSSAEQKNELLSIFRERINDKDRDTDRMERLIRDMMQTTTNIAQGTAQNNEVLKNEYRERLERQEDRMDNTQDKALDYATKNNVIFKDQIGSSEHIYSQEPISQTYYTVDIEGKENDIYYLPQLIIMVRKGLVKADTFVFSSSIQDCVMASQLKEIAHLFKL